MKKKKKKKLKSLKTLKSKAWKLFSEWVRCRDVDKNNLGLGFTQCVTCLTAKPWKQMQAGHFIPKSHGLVYFFHEKNVHPQCEYCNIWDKENAKIKYTQWMMKKYGPGIIDELQQLKQTPVKYSRGDYEALIETLNMRLEAL